MKKSIFLPTFVIFSVLAIIAGFFGFIFWLFGGNPSTIAVLSILGLDTGVGFAIIKMFNHTAFLRASGRRQFFYGK